MQNISIKTNNTLFLYKHRLKFVILLQNAFDNIKISTIQFLKITILKAMPIGDVNA